MMRRYWELVRGKVDDMSLRERAMIFTAAAFLVVSLLNATLLDPLLTRQKMLSAEVAQKEEKMKELQALMQSLLQARSDDEHSPLRQRIAQLNAQLQEQETYLQSRRDRMVEPDKMAGLLEQVLNRNGKLELVALSTLPVSLLIENPQAEKAAAALPEVSGETAGQKQIFKHGVKITVRGGYLELLQYLAELEKLPTQMFWGEVSLNVDQYPRATMTLVLYTLSLDELWLKV